MATPTAPVSARVVVGEGLRLVGGFARARPLPFVLAVGGAALFAGAILAASQVIGWVTDAVIVPVLAGGEPREGKLLPAVLAILGVAVWKAAAIVLRRNAAGYLQFKTQQDVREQLIEHQLGLSLSWFGRQSRGDRLARAANAARQAPGVRAPCPYARAVSRAGGGTVVVGFLIDFWVGTVALVGMALVVFVEVRAAVTVYPAWEGIQK